MEVDLESIRELIAAALNRALKDARFIADTNMGFTGRSKQRLDLLKWYRAPSTRPFSYRWMMSNLRYTASQKKLIDDELRKSPIFK